MRVAVVATPAGVRGGRGEDYQAWVLREEVREVRHEEVAELLGGEEGGGWGAGGYGQEDFVWRGEVREGGRGEGGGYFGQDGLGGWLVWLGLVLR